MYEDIENLKIQLGHLQLPLMGDEHYRAVTVAMLAGIIEILERLDDEI